MKTSESGVTTDAVTLFENLGQRGYEPLLRKVTGRVRFDVVTGADTDAWLVTIDKGAVAVARERSAADCTVRGDHELFDDLASGSANVMAAVLRGALTCTGNVDLLIAAERIFPAPVGDQEPSRDARSTP